MRLWHYKLIPFLPKSQLLAQWRELNSIFKKQDKHILINYIYNYPKTDLLYYSRLVMNDMMIRGIKIKSFDKFNAHFADVSLDDNLEACPEESPKFVPFKNDHNDEYLAICYFNLLEKFQRGQKDFKGELMADLDRYCRPIIERYLKNEQL